MQHLAIVNFCSVTNKQAELEAFLAVHNIHFLLGMDSHLDDMVTNSEIFPNYFHAYRKDRNIHGGEVFILVIDHLVKYILIHHVRLLCTTPRTNSQKIILGSFYSPPNSPTSIWDELSYRVQQVQEQFPDAIFIPGGDFN